MTRLRLKNKVAAFLAASGGLLLGPLPADAVQTKDVGDGGTVYARISEKELTRLAVSPGRIATLRVKQGELGIDPDDDTGQLFLSVPAGSKKPVNGFLTTDTGNTYTLVLEIVDAPADSIVINQPQPKEAKTRNDLKTTPYEKVAKRLVTLMASDELPSDLKVKQVGKKLDLWKEASMTLESQYFIGDLVGERYIVANTSAADMILDEREFYRKGVGVVALDQLTLAPGMSTRLYVVREKAQNE